MMEVFAGLLDHTDQYIGATGFGHLGCYGSPISTPYLDELAAEAELLLV